MTKRRPQPITTSPKGRFSDKAPSPFVERTPPDRSKPSFTPQPRVKAPRARPIKTRKA